MDERTSWSAADSHDPRRRRRPWRGVLVALALAGGWLLPSSVGDAQTNGTAQSRVCSRLQAAVARVGDQGSARQALTARLQRFGCLPTGPTTTATPGTVTPTTFTPTSLAPPPGVPTTVPGGTTVPPVPCSSTTTIAATTTTGQFPPTTIPCAP